MASKSNMNLSDAPIDETARQAELSPEGESACAAGGSAAIVLARLQEQGLVADAVAFLAHALPKREAVWWGLLCIWDVRRPAASASEERAYRALVRWLQEPSEEHRRDVEAAGKALHRSNLAAHLARAAFVSGGSVLAPGAGSAPPKPHLTALLVRKILNVAATLAAPLDPELRLTSFLRVGLEIAEQKNRWTPDTPPK